MRAQLLLLSSSLIFSTWVNAAESRFAIIGDYGTDNAAERLVANFVITNLQPQFIVTLGDNNYGAAGDYDETVGKYYARYLGNYRGAYGPGSVTNRFFPAIGNHDYFAATGYDAYTDYFTLPGNERYYEFTHGPVHFFMLNNDLNEPDGVSSTSTQALWLSNRLATSSAPWKLVVAHYAPYSSSGSHHQARWPYGEWGADIVLTGHAHNYERVELDGLPYFVNGAGGAPFHPVGAAVPGSQVRIDDYYGAMLAIADDARITFEFYSAADGVRRDRLVLERPRLRIGRLPTASTVDITWPTNRTSGYRLETRRGVSPWSPVPHTPAIRGGNHVLTLAITNQMELLRLHRPNTIER